MFMCYILNWTSQTNVNQEGIAEDEAPILVERGIVYFFSRPRVNVNDPQGVDDLQRTYFVLRPVPQDVKLKDSLEKDHGNCRLFALPKKAFPRHHSERPMAFIEKGNATVSDLKKDFLGGAEHMTKTRGVQHQQPVMPIAEGVYSITHIGRSTYLTYVLTIPEKIGEVQKDIGLKHKGSFLISVKNPERPGPQRARLPKSPEYPKESVDREMSTARY
jgi:hypothetical protein